MNNVKKWLIPLVILLIAAFVVNTIFNNPPKSRRGGPPSAPKMTVDVKPLVTQNYTVVVDSFGTVQPTIQSALVAQVSGQIVEVSPKFRSGGFFKKGDVLLKIDPRDFEANVKIAQAGLISAKQELIEARANADQAKRIWQPLGDGQSPSDLALRKPQLEAAKARLVSAQASLERAELALERTHIIAPFDGRILRQQVDLGQVLPNNTVVAQIYATDSVEIRLPINNSDIELVNFPDEYADTDKTNNKIEARFTSSLSQNQTWIGQVIRTEAAIDTVSQQLFVVARIHEPYNPELHPGSPIKIGQYVSAEIQGKTLENALVIANSSIYQGSYVYVVEDDLLMRKDITIGWQNGHEAIITEGLSSGDLLVTTALGQVSSGTRVLLKGEKPKQSTPPKDREARLAKAAKRMGISVEELKAKRQNAQGRQPSNNKGRPANDE